jgi:hypothetical protein
MITGGEKVKIWKDAVLVYLKALKRLKKTIERLFPNTWLLGRDRFYS